MPLVLVLNQDIMLFNLSEKPIVLHREKLVNGEGDSLSQVIFLGYLFQSGDALLQQRPVHAVDQPEITVQAKSHTGNR